MTRWVRNRPSRQEEAMAGLAAVGVGAAVGLVVYYVARLFMSRDALPEPASSPPDEGVRRLTGTPTKRLPEPES